VPLPKILDTDDLVYPFRFDIVTRERFLSFYDANRKLYENDSSTFFAKALDSSYFKFFEAIPAAHGWVARKHGGSLSMEELFAIRGTAFIELYDSISKGGYRRELGGVTLKCPWSIDGDSYGQQFFLGDGCHRLAILRHLRGTQLERSFFHRKFLYRAHARNNTLTMAEKGALSAEDVACLKEKCPSVDFIQKMYSEK
jgi:hypothetical protein